MKIKTPYKFALLFVGLAKLAYVAVLGARVIVYTNAHFSRYTPDLALLRAA